MRLVAFALLTWLVSITAAAGELNDAVPIFVGDDPLDVEQAGHAAPFVADFDDDGVKDLLVGEFYKGRLRIYRNIGSNPLPRFEGFTLFQNGDPSGCIHASCCMGFAPQLVDLDDDGRRDVLSGNWLHQVILFHGRSDGTFGDGAPIEDRDRRPVKIGYGVTAFAADWDADGDLDLLAGTVENAADQGNVYVVPNEGAPGKNAFGKPEPLIAHGKPILAADGGAAPVAADWDGDGKLDLILGCGDGSVRWYRNCAETGDPALADFENLVDPPAKMENRGKRAKPCVVDWNEDGRLDLLVGDVGADFQKLLNSEEEKWRAEAVDQQSAHLKDWAKAFARYRNLRMAKELSEDRQHEVDAARDELARLSTIRRRFVEQEQCLKPGTQAHGRVWLFLRR